MRVYMIIMHPFYVSVNKKSEECGAGSENRITAVLRRV